MYVTFREEFLKIKPAREYASMVKEELAKVEGIDVSNVKVK